MKSSLLLSSCLLLTACATPVVPTSYTLNSGAERTPEQLAVVFEHADLTFRVDPAQRSITGDARLTFLASAPLTRFALDLDRNLPVDAVEVDGQPLAPHDYANPEGRLSITLPATIAAGQRTTIRVRYHGVPHVAVKAPWDGGMVWSNTADGAPWVASAVQGEGCDLFWPCIDHPMGKAQLIDQHIQVPSPLVAAGNGVALGMDEKDGWRTWHWRAKHPSTYGIALNIAPYRTMQGEYASRYGNRIPLQFWYLPESEAKARGLFDELPPMLDFFESVIGPYPFGDEKVGIAETPHKGMEHQTINAYGNKYAKTGYGYDELLQHEFAHEWFGNQLTNSNWDDMWLHEGFGSYMQPLYMQYLRGDQEYFASLQQIRTGILNKAPIVSGKPKTEEEVYDIKKGGPGGDIYAKGALVLHTLRGLIGDQAFFRAVRLLVYGTEQPLPGQFQPRYGSTTDFMAIVNKVTGGNYDWFFQVYLYQAALPELSAVRDGDTLRLAWKTPADLPFPMPVEVRIGKDIQTVPMALGFGELHLPAGATYTLDPHSRVLRRAEHIEQFQKFREEQAKGKKG